MSKELAAALRETLTSPNVSDRNGEPANLVDALDEIGSAIRFAAKHLGSGDAATPMGALEALGKVLLDGSERLSEAVTQVANAINDTDRTPSRESMRFTAALTIYQSMTAHMFARRDADPSDHTNVVDFAAKYAVEQADLLLFELNKQRG